MTRTITVTRSNLDRFIAAYQATLREGRRRGGDTFIIDGAEVRMDYAEYAIEYMAENLGVGAAHYTAMYLRKLRIGDTPCKT